MTTNTTPTAGPRVGAPDRPMTSGLRNAAWRRSAVLSREPRVGAPDRRPSVGGDTGECADCGEPLAPCGDCLACEDAADMAALDQGPGRGDRGVRF